MNFRKGIGAIVLDKKGNIIVFQRNDYKDSWQGPEGGIDENETAIDALKRELWEEIGLSSEKYEILKETKDFIRYKFEKPFMGFDGQDKKFFLIKLISEPNFKFDNKEDEIEFSNFKIIEAKEMIKLAPTFKKEVYLKVLEEFDLK